MLRSDGAAKGNKGKITKSYVDGQTEPGLYWDTELRGFGLCISGKTKTYIVQARVNGRDKRRSIGRHGVLTAEEARKAARQALALMARGVDPKDEARARRIAGISLWDVTEAYLERGRLKPRTVADYRGYVARYFRDWADRPLVGIKADMVERRHAELVERHGGAQADVAMRFLRALFNFAEGKYQRADGEPLVASNPTKRLSALKLWARPARRERYVKETDLARWYEAVCSLGNNGTESEIQRDYLLFLLFTGLRRTEAMGMRWAYVDFEGRQFRLPAEDTKNGTAHSLPMTTVTERLLRQRYNAKTNEFVFPGRGRTGHLVDPKGFISRVTEASGVGFSPHDLRRTFATCAATVIDSERTIKRLMNHLTGNQDVTEGYKQGVERLREPAQKITEYMLRLVNPLGTRDALTNVA